MPAHVGTVVTEFDLLALLLMLRLWCLLGWMMMMMMIIKIVIMIRLIEICLHNIFGHGDTHFVRSMEVPFATVKCRVRVKTRAVFVVAVQRKVEVRWWWLLLLGFNTISHKNERTWQDLGRRAPAILLVVVVRDGWWWGPKGTSFWRYRYYAATVTIVPIPIIDGCKESPKKQSHHAPSSSTQPKGLHRDDVCMSKLRTEF